VANKQGLYENNLIACELAIPADQGTRIGLSFGGGGMGKTMFRNNNCCTEHVNGTIRNNIIINCSHDVGIYINASRGIEIYNNLMFNSMGIDVRFRNGKAKIYNNILSGRIKARDGGSYTEQNNLIDIDCLDTNNTFSDCALLAIYEDIMTLDLSLVDGNDILKKGIKTPAEYDLCGEKFDTEAPDLGPIQYSVKQSCLAGNQK